MKQNFSWKIMGKVIFITGFISGPAITLAGYSIYALRSWLATSHNYIVPYPIYLIVLLLAMVGAMWITAGRLLKELRESGLKQEKANNIEND